MSKRNLRGAALLATLTGYRVESEAGRRLAPN